MVAANSPTEKREIEARARAAAWAWYQRSGGSLSPSAGRSEAFAMRCSSRPCSSRFQREAAFRVRASASTVSESALTSFSSIDNSSSLSQGTAGLGDESSSLDQVSDCDTDHDSSLDVVALHPTACWDCGSSLFDSYELVAMSKKLDVELHETNIDAGGNQDLDRASSVGLGMHHEGFQQQKVLSLCDTPYNPTSPPSSPPGLSNDCDAYDTQDAYDGLSSDADNQSKQAVYDMFCQYGDALKHATKVTISKQSLADTACGEQFRKHKPRTGRMSFYALAKALHSIRNSSSHLSRGVSAAHEHHHHHHPLSHQHQQGKTLSSKGVQKGAGWFGDGFVYDDALDKGQRKERHIHHHHHHHYHYLFHSDDDVGKQYLDKSLVVAAAGLRSPKVNPTLSSYLESPARVDMCMDYGRKWADLGIIPPPPAFKF